MASSGRDRRFASVAASKVKDTKLVLNTKLVQLTKENVEGIKELITEVYGRIRVTPPKEESERERGRWCCSDV